MLKVNENLTQKEYRGIKDFLSSSDIKILLDNPYKFNKEYKDKVSDSLLLGSAVHSLILEKENFKRDFLILPDLDLRNKKDKEIKQELETEALSNNQILLKSDLHKKAVEIVESFNNLRLSNLFKGGKAEVSFFGDINGIPCKCRTDYFFKEKGLILDLKTTSAENGASADNFSKAVANFKYYIQAAFYLQLTGAKEFYFIIIETNAPFMVGVYKLDVQALEFGEKEIKRAFEIYKNLDKYNENVFLDFENDYKIVQEITLPNYVYYKKGASF